MKYPVSNPQLQVIVGGLLGDSHIRQRYYKGHPCNAHIVIMHSPKQESYLEWKTSLYEDMVTKSKIRKEKDGRVSFYTKSLPKLNPFMELFGKPKKVTRKILNLLDPLGLAVWYMDDGTLGIEYYKRLDGNYGIKRRRIAIATESFSLKEQKIIKKYFKVVWKIDINIQAINKNRDDKKTTYRISMNYSNSKKFVKIIKSHIHNSMKYKIDFNRPKIVC